MYKKMVNEIILEHYTIEHWPDNVEILDRKTRQRVRMLDEQQLFGFQGNDFYECWVSNLHENKKDEFKKAYKLAMDLLNKHFVREVYYRKK